MLEVVHPLRRMVKTYPPTVADALIAQVIAPTAPVNSGAPLTVTNILSMFVDLKTAMLIDVCSLLA